MLMIFIVGSVRTALHCGPWPTSLSAGASRVTFSTGGERVPRLDAEGGKGRKTRGRENERKERDHGE